MANVFIDPNDDAVIWHAAPYKTSRTLRDDITDSQEGKMLCAVMPDGEI